MRAAFTFAFILILHLNVSAMNEQGRLRSHLRLVENLLRTNEHPEMSSTQIQNRKASLDALREYWQKGKFPQNISYPDGRLPIFVDHRGVHCAVGYLIMRSGHEKLVQRLNEKFHNYYLEEMTDPDLNTWVAESGFTLEELRLIQPAYAYKPQSSDDFVEAAFLGDLEKVQSLLPSLEPLSQESARIRLNEALRAVAPVADLKPLKKSLKNEKESIGIYQEPPPFKGKGMSVLQLLLEKGANPNDESNHRGTIYSLAKTSEVRKILEAKGGKLSATDRIQKAIETRNVEEVVSVLDSIKTDDVQAQAGYGVPVATLAVRGYIYDNKKGNQELPKLIPYNENKHPHIRIYLALLKSKKIPDIFEYFEPNSRPMINMLASHGHWDLVEILIDHGVKPAEGQESRSFTEYWLASRYHSTNNTHLNNIINLNKIYFTPARITKFDDLLKALEAPTPDTIRDYASENMDDPVRFKDYIVYVSKMGWGLPPGILSTYIARLNLKTEKVDITLIERLSKSEKKVSEFDFLKAVASGNLELITLFLKIGADINSTSNGFTCPPLALAVETNNLKVARLLLKNKANPRVNWEAKYTGCITPTPVAFPKQTVSQSIEKMKMSSEMKSLLYGTKGN